MTEYSILLILLNIIFYQDKINISLRMIKKYFKDHTRIRRRMLNDMRQVEIDTIYIRVFWSDQVNVDPKTTSNINKPFYVLETIVVLKNLLHNYFGITDHGCIENLVEPWVQACIIKGMCAMNHVEWDTPFSNCILKLGPKNEETTMYLITILINEETGCWDWKGLDWKAYLAKQNSCCNVRATIL